MYSLSQFTEEDQSRVMEFMHANPFALLCGSDRNNHPVATQVPVFIDRRGDQLFLSGHMMRKTDHHLGFEFNPNVLAVFTGPHTYVSASWYQDKRSASTWNYMSVHAHGKLSFLGHTELIDVLKRTTNHFENNPYSGANFDDIPRADVEQMAKAIVAFEVEVTSLKNVFKLSQNKNRDDYTSVVEHLGPAGGDSEKIAGEMVKREKELFDSGAKK
ncbi:MAG: FMN-binding negative transcriptional regulator [Chitinophagaceae bacterium]|nr:MAG: FMN-binding negative transcriptional regulator [Chitinophagaceae bacterium]